MPKLVTLTPDELALLSRTPPAATSDLPESEWTVGQEILYLPLSDHPRIVKIGPSIKTGPQAHPTPSTEGE